MHIVLVGDFDAALPAHAAVDASLAQCAGAMARGEVTWSWLASKQAGEARALAAADGIWCVPGTPYASIEGVLAAIRFARETDVPFLGTCGGFQHAVLEHARHVMRWRDAGHAEVWPDAPRPVIAALRQPLVNIIEPLKITDQRFLNLHMPAGETCPEAHYACRYGIHTDMAAQLWDGDFVPVATGPDGAVRAVMRRRHPFFFGTLYQPELQALLGQTHPLIKSLVRACLARIERTRDTPAAVVAT